MICLKQRGENLHWKAEKLENELRAHCAHHQPIPKVSRYEVCKAVGAKTKWKNCSYQPFLDTWQDEFSLPHGRNIDLHQLSHESESRMSPFLGHLKAESISFLPRAAAGMMQRFQGSLGSFNSYLKSSSLWVADKHEKYKVNLWSTFRYLKT